MYDFFGEVVYHGFDCLMFCSNFQFSIIPAMQELGFGGLTYGKKYIAYRSAWLGV